MISGAKNFGSVFDRITLPWSSVEFLGIASEAAMIEPVDVPATVVAWILELFHVFVVLFDCILICFSFEYLQHFGWNEAANAAAVN